MKKPILLIFTLAFLITACSPSVGAANPTEIPVVTEPPPAETVPADCDATIGVSLSAVPDEGEVNSSSCRPSAWRIGPPGVLPPGRG